MGKATGIIKFDWDGGNKNKNWGRHHVSDKECEEIFFDSHKKILKDALHSANEDRYILLGQTKSKKLLFLVFTVRKNKIRIISARALIKKKNIYMKKKLKIPKFKNEDQERDFWSKVKLEDHFRPDDFESVSFGDLKPSSRSISIRLPEYLLARLKEKANALNVPYQSLIKQYIAKGLFM